MGRKRARARMRVGVTQGSAVWYNTQSRSNSMAVVKESPALATQPREERGVVANSRFGYETSKRLFDISYSIVFLILGLPFMVLCGLLMKLESHGPMFYSQKRVGKNGKLFTAYKLRSMPNNSEANGPVITALDGDTRPGPVGRFIRKSKIDELPQFLNVLMGEMSVVGPRPERPYFVDKFTKELPNFHNRHLVRPGVTGLAQIKEKDSLQIRSKLRYDLLYISKRSFGFDMAILWSTVWFCFHYLSEAMGLAKSTTNGNGGPTELT